MRKRITNNGVTVHAIAGTHVVTLGFDLSAKARKGCLGFAIQRTDHTEDEVYWMDGMKTFAATDPLLGPGGQVSSHEHPFQSFQWADYAAKPGHDYSYRAVALYGTPDKLKDGGETTVRLKTEAEQGATHTIYFNRGAIASQEYARRFQNRSPDDVGAPAFKWLSRGLLEAFIAFVERAADKDYDLHGAVYEFQRKEPLAAIRAAKGRGAKIKILYDGIPSKTGPKKKNEKAIDAQKLKTVTDPRTVGSIMHNKFLVLSKKKKPIAVWLGSTNLTDNGLFGHLNCGHVVDDADLAAAYLDYFKQISQDEALKEDREWMASENDAPPNPWSDDLTHVFSPRKGLEVLDWYAEIADSAKQGLFMTFAFGMHDSFKQVYEQNDGVLRFALMEKEGNGAGLAQGRIDVARIRKLPNVVVAIGRSIPASSGQKTGFDNWLEEREKLSSEVNVKYIHTKFMLVDPLGKSPIVVTGSANFSAASTNSNHENMLVIRNDTRVADIYLGEFMRSFSHYSFREAVAREAAKKTKSEWTPNYLIPDASWQRDYFKAGHPRHLRREYFAG